MNPLYDVVLSGDVLTSSELINRLTSSGCSRENARQIASRNANKNGIWRSTNIVLERDERIFARTSTLGSKAFLTKIIQKLSATSRLGLARCLEALKNRGCIHKIDAMRLLAVSSEGTHSEGRIRRTYSKELKALKELGCEVVDENTETECLCLPGKEADDTEILTNAANLEVRKNTILARVLVDRLRKQNILSWNSTDTFDDGNQYVTFNGQVFSGRGFSYLSPLVSWRDERPSPCPVMIDSYNGICGKLQLKSFLERLSHATYRSGSRQRMLGLVAAKDFHHDVWLDARNAGLLTISYRQVFGDEALEALTLVEEILHDLTSRDPSTIKKKFETYAEFLGDLKNNPIVVALRSLGFEAFAGTTLCSLGCHGVELGRNVPWKQATREVDAYGITGKELKIIECKALTANSPVLPEDVRKFFTETVPALMNWLRTNNRAFSKCTAEIWTTGHVPSDTLNALNAIKKKPMNEYRILTKENLLEILPESIKRVGGKLMKAITVQSKKEYSETKSDIESVDVQFNNLFA